MAIYQITHFNSAALPLYNPEQQLSPPAVPSTLVQSIGGQFDYAGTRRELASRDELTVSGIYVASATVYLVDHAGRYIVDHAGNRIIVATALGHLRNQVEALTDQLGYPGTLWRKRWDDETVRQWKTARLRQVRQRHDYSRRINVVELEAMFESTMTAWRAATATTVTANLVSGGSGGSVGLRLTGNGDVRVDDAVLTITAAGTITSLKIVGVSAGISLAYIGTLTAGQTLTINAGAQTVRVGSSNRYQYFALGAAHTADGWLPIVPGISSITVTSDGPGTVSVSYYGQFA